MKHFFKKVSYSIGLSFILGIATLNYAGESTDGQLVLKYVNEVRAKHHLGPLKMNALMSQEAYRHSIAMSTHQIPFGHIGFDKRIKTLYRDIPKANGGSENVAAGKWNARQVVDGWMNSPGHRRNILGHYHLTGIGISRDKQGRIYYTQLFLRNDGATPTRTRHRTRAPFVFAWH